MSSYNSIAYTEVLEILKYIPQEKYKLIPDRVIESMMKNCDEKCNFTYNIGVPFERQKISKKAIEILEFFDKNFWNASESSQVIINQVNIAKLFNNKAELKESTKDSKVNTSLVATTPKNWIMKLIDRLKSFKKMFGQNK